MSLYHCEISKLVLPSSWQKEKNPNQRWTRTVSVQLTSPPSSPSKEGAKVTVDSIGAHRISSVFFHLRHQKKDRNPPLINESLGTDGVSSDLSRLPPQKKDRNPSQSTTLLVITASPPSVLVFSDVRRLYQSSRRLLFWWAMC
ncbi:unnamed protein product [Brassica rapa subsp. narinosa]